MSFIQEAKKLVGEERPKVAIEFTINHLEFFTAKNYNGLKNTFLLLQSEEKALQNQMKNGLIKYDDWSLERNKINSRVLSTLDDLSDLISKSSKDQEKGRTIKESDRKNAKERTEIIVRNLKILTEIGQFGIVREKGNLSTFSIPNRPTTNPAWNGKLRWRNDDKEGHLAKNYILQRYWLEKHATNKYCKLIVHLEDGLKTKTTGAGLYRLKTLLEFIKSNRDKVDIVNADDYGHEKYENLLIVGGRWDKDKEGLYQGFYAKSEVGTESGIEDTFISPDPKKIEEEIHKFDKEFDDILQYLNLDVYEARNQVIQWLEARILILEEEYKNSK